MAYQSPVLESLFRNESFVSDLVRAATLPEQTLEAIILVLQHPASYAEQPYTDSEVASISESTGLSSAVVRRTLVLTSYLASLLNSSVKMSEMSADIATLLVSKGQEGTPFLERLQRLETIRHSVATVNERRLALEKGVTRLSEFSVSCDLRIRTGEPTPTEPEAVAAYQPQILELIPVVNIKLVGKLDEGSTEFVTQLTAPELRRLLASLQVAEKQLQAAATGVALQAPRDSGDDR